MAYKFELDKINYVAIAEMAHNINKAVLETQGYLSKDVFDINLTEWQDLNGEGQQIAIDNVKEYVKDNQFCEKPSEHWWSDKYIASQAIYAAVIKNMIAARQGCQPKPVEAVILPQPVD